MNIKQTMRNLVLGVLMMLGALFVTPLTANAACGVDSDGNPVKTSIINCDTKDKDGDGKVDSNETGLWQVLIITINILTAGVGVLALAGIVYGAILYTSAGGNSEQVKKAMGVFTNVVIGVVAFAGMFAFLNFIIPGGAFNSL